MDLLIDIIGGTVILYLAPWVIAQRAAKGWYSGRPMPFITEVNLNMGKEKKDGGNKSGR